MENASKRKRNEQNTQDLIENPSKKALSALPEQTLNDTPLSSQESIGLDSSEETTLKSVFSSTPRFLNSLNDSQLRDKLLDSEKVENARSDAKAKMNARRRTARKTDEWANKPDLVDLMRNDAIEAMIAYGAKEVHDVSGVSSKSDYVIRLCMQGRLQLLETFFRRNYEQENNMVHGIVFKSNQGVEWLFKNMIEPSVDGRRAEIMGWLFSVANALSSNDKDAVKDMGIENYIENFATLVWRRYLRVVRAKLVLHRSDPSQMAELVQYLERVCDIFGRANRSVLIEMLCNMALHDMYRDVMLCELVRRVSARLSILSLSELIRIGGMSPAELLPVMARPNNPDTLAWIEDEISTSSGWCRSAFMLYNGENTNKLTASIPYVLTSSPVYDPPVIVTSNQDDEEPTYSNRSIMQGGLLSVTSISYLLIKEKRLAAMTAVCRSPSTEERLLTHAWARVFCDIDAAEAQVRLSKDADGIPMYETLSVDDEIISQINSLITETPTVEYIYEALKLCESNARKNARLLIKPEFNRDLRSYRRIPRIGIAVRMLKQFGCALIYAAMRYKRMELLATLVYSNEEQLIPTTSWSRLSTKKDPNNQRWVSHCISKAKQTIKTHPRLTMDTLQHVGVHGKRMETILKRVQEE